MAYEVLRTPQVAAALRDMRGRERRVYEAARDALRGEGCRAGGYRLAGIDDDDDYPLCCKHLAFAWRMFTAYLDSERIAIVALEEHDRDHNPAAELAEVLPGLSAVGRRRSEMNDELRELLAALA